VIVSFDVIRKKDGRVHAVKGRVVGWVSRGKKVCAIVVVRRSFLAVPIGDIRLVRR